MRDGNFPMKSCTKSTPLARDLPMRDGNYLKGGETLAVRDARDLPMRDGNFRQSMYLRLCAPARDLPMRDGNNAVHEDPFSDNLRPRPSYEGWKPNNSGKSYEQAVCPRPSYEGWKHGRIFIATIRRENARDLPMRDGNYARSSSGGAPCHARDLPVRDGNYI